MNSLDNVASVMINIELFMYGYVGLCLSGGDDCVFASWIAVADGGDVIENETKEIPGKNFYLLAKNLRSIALPKEDDEDGNSRYWDISFNDAEDNQIKGIERGFWSIDDLNAIVETIEDYTGDTEITAWLHNIIEA